MGSTEKNWVKIVGEVCGNKELNGQTKHKVNGIISIVV